MILNQATYVDLNANSMASAFSFPNKVFAATDLVVTLIDPNGNEYAFTNFANATLGLSYNVANVDNDGGCQVVFSSAPATGWTIDIRTLTPDTQPTSIKNQGAFLPELHEEAFDRITRELQDLRRLTYTFGVHGEDLESVPWNTVPPPQQRLGQVMMFDSITGAFTLGAPVTQLLTQALIGSFLYQPHPGELATGGVVNLYIPYGYVERYGAIANSDPANLVNQNAIQIALTANAGYYPVVFSGTNNNFYGGLTNPLTIPARSHIVGRNGAEVRWASTNPGSGPLWLGSASRPGLWLQGGNFRLEGDITFSGPTVQTGSNGLPGGTSSGGTFVSLETGFICVGTSITAPISNVYLGPEAKFRWWGYDGIGFQYVENFDITGLKIRDCGYGGGHFLSCENGRAWGNTVGYIDPGNASGVLNCYGFSFTADSSSSTAGTSRTDANRFCLNVKAWSNTFHDIPRWSGLDAHGGYEISFGPDNHTYNCCNTIEIGPFTNGASNTYGSENCQIIDNTCRILRADGSATTVGVIGAGIALGPYINGGAQGNALNPRIHNNLVDGYGSIGAGPAPNGYPIQFSFASNYSVKANTLLNWSGFGLYSSSNNSQGGVIEGNIFGPVSTIYSNDSCIRLDGYASPPVVRGNVHNLLTGTAAHFGLSVVPTLPAGLWGDNDFSAAQTAPYGNNVGGALVLTRFLGQTNPLVVGLGSAVSNMLKGTQAMAGTSVAVALGVTLPSAAYQVVFAGNLTGGPFWVTSKSATGFTINAGSSFTGNVDWLLLL